MKSWKGVLLAAAAALSISACGKPPTASQPSAAAVSGDPALALVQRFNMGSGLESLANQAARSTTTYGVVVQARGASGADQLIEGEISKALPAYQSRWNENLASIYGRHFSQEELRSLVTQGTSSPYAGKFRATQSTIASEMRASSSQILQQLATEALASAAKQ